MWESWCSWPLARLRLPEISEHEVEASNLLKFMEIHWPRFYWTLSALESRWNFMCVNIFLCASEKSINDSENEIWVVKMERLENENKYLILKTSFLKMAKVHQGSWVSNEIDWWSSYFNEASVQIMHWCQCHWSCWIINQCWQFKPFLTQIFSQPAWDGNQTRKMYDSLESSITNPISLDCFLKNTAILKIGLKFCNFVHIFYSSFLVSLYSR